MVQVCKKVGASIVHVGEISQDLRLFEPLLDWACGVPFLVEEALEDGRLFEDNEVGDYNGRNSWDDLPDDGPRFDDVEVSEPDRHHYSFLADDLEAPSFEPLRKTAAILFPEAYRCSGGRQPSRSWKWHAKRARTNKKKPSKLRTQHRWNGAPSARLFSAKLAEAEAERRLHEEFRLLTIVKDDGRLTLIAL